MFTQVVFQELGSQLLSSLSPRRLRLVGTMQGKRSPPGSLLPGRPVPAPRDSAVLSRTRSTHALLGNGDLPHASALVSL